MINKIIIIISLIISALIFLFFVMPGLYKPVIGWQIFTRTASLKKLQLVSFTIIVFLTYLYTTATFSSFPKYVIPVLPMWCCLIATQWIYGQNNLIISVSTNNLFFISDFSSYYIIESHVYAVIKPRYLRLVDFSYCKQRIFKPYST